MGEITQDGFSFDSDWIDARVAKFTDRNAPWAWRRVKLEREIAGHESAMQVLLKDWPHDLQAQAHAKAYVAALEKTLKELDAEMLKGR
jgi:hypothetical protein